MLKRVILCALISASTIVCAAVKPGQNILINGSFEAEQPDIPMFWQRTGEQTSLLPSGGPDKTGALIFSNKTGAEGVGATYRQLALQLVAGETYKISCYVKTSGFKSRYYGIIIHNSGWRKENGIRSLPENTDGWQLVEKSFKLHQSQNEIYGAAIFAKDYVGEIQFANIKLEACSDGALAGSSASMIMDEHNKLRLVPWKPLLNKIPASDPRMAFHLFGKLEHAHAAYDCVCTIDGSTLRKAPLTQKLNIVDLSGIALGEHALDIAIVERNAEKQVFRMTHAATVVATQEIDTSAHRRLNNLAVEVLAKPLQADSSPQMYEFSTARDGWVFIKVESTADAPELIVVLDGVETVITAASDRHEAFHEVAQGNHSLTLKGAVHGGRIVVRSICELLHYPACGNSQVPQNGKYDWDFHVKYVFPSATTLNGGNIPPAHRPKLQALGLKWLGSVGTTSPKDAADLINRMSNHPGMTKPWYNGFTCDEQFFSRYFDLAYYTEALRLFENPENRLIYSWATGKPNAGLLSIHSDFISAALNASKGRGRLLFEVYCRSKPTEKEAASYLNDYAIDTVEKLNDCYPNALTSSGIILGNFNQIPIISQDHYPEVDYKYFLDMQLNLLANDPIFKDLGMTGYWGSYYGDEELYRWSFRLLRHYCVEGNTEMLSKTYGYNYAPGHLKNCDFVDGIEHWETANTNSLRTAKFAGYGADSQSRWGASRVGDTFCIFLRGAGEPSTLVQTAKGLTPGRIYTLQFITADYKDMLTGKFDPKLLTLDASLGKGAEIIPEKSYVFVDRRNSGKKKNDGKVRINLHHIRFKAIASSFTVTFSNAKAANGTEIALNYVMLKPYFEE